MAHQRPSQLTDFEVQAALEKVQSSKAFTASDRNKRFLEYIVRETLAGREDRIKAYNIAISVFGRGKDFDPQQDAIVRIEAGRLRRALEHFYLTDGIGEEVRIGIPKGRYVPEFAIRSDTKQPGAPRHEPDSMARQRWRGPRILVATFEDEGNDDRYPDFARRLSRQVISGLTRFTDIFVYGSYTSETYNSGTDSSRIAKDLEVDFLLSGSVSFSGNSLQVRLLLTRMRDECFVWADDIVRDVEATHLAELRDEVASRVVSSLAQPYGIVSSLARDNPGAPPEDFSNYKAILDFQDYLQTFDPTDVDRVRLGLDRAIAKDPGFAEAKACLSIVCTNAVRFGHSLALSQPDLLDRAIQLAKSARILAPSSCRACYAMALAEWFAGDPERAITTMHMAHDLNPNDTEILAELGLMHALRMHWDKSLPLIEEAYLRNPLQPGTHRTGVFLYHFAHGRYDEALREALHIGAPGVAYGHLCIAAARSKLGHMEKARRSLAILLRIVPNYTSHMVEDLEFRHVHPDLITALCQAIRKIGDIAAPACTNLTTLRG